MTRTIRPGIPVPSFRSMPPGPRPGYRPPVNHSHGSRRQLGYETQDSRSAIIESMEEEPLADWERELLYGADTSADEARDAWIRSAQEARRRLDSREAIRALRVRLTGDDPVKPERWHITKDHRVPVFEIAKHIGLTSSQALVLINGYFNEWAPSASSTVATIVADKIESWCATAEAGPIIAAIKEA